MHKKEGMNIAEESGGSGQPHPGRVNNEIRYSSKWFMLLNHKEGVCLES